MKRLLHTKALITKENIATNNGVIENVVGSTAVTDRMGDIIEQSGWKLSNFKVNPVILYGHNAREERMPIGKALKVWIEGKGSKNAKLMFNIQFDLQDSFAAEVYRKIKDGFLNTVSVGFQPFEWEELDPDNWFGGLRFLEQDLLELSVVPIPANPQAVIPMKSFAATDKRFTPVEEKDAFPQVEDNRFKKMLHESKEVTLEKVSENKDSELVTEFRSVDEFQEDSFRALPMTKSGKDYVIILGKLKDSDAYTEQSFHYAKDAWSAEEVAEHKQETVNPDYTSDEEGKVTEKETEDDEVTDDSNFTQMTVYQMKEMMDRVWEDGYEAGDQSDDEDKSKAVMPEDETKVKELKVGEAKAVIESCFSNKRPKEGKSVDTEEEKSTVTEAKELADTLTKSGRVLSAKNEKKVRQAVELLSSVLSALDIQADEEDSGKSSDDLEMSKKVVPYKDLGTLPESESWDSPGEVAKADIAGLKLMSAWYDDENVDDKSSYKLIHHKGDADHKAVWRGVAACMGALLGAKGTEIPEEDRKAVYNHLVKHYKEFGKEAPDFSMVENQVLSGLSEEVQALILDREDKHAVRLLKRILDNQKAEKRATAARNADVNEASPEQAKQALEVLLKALEKANL
jgi:HK97 family phage prohead protease